jgi:hypothetical protein
MTLIKTDHQLEQVMFTFDGNGDVVDVRMTVSYSVEDDVTSEQETRVRKVVSVFDSLPPGINQAATNTFGKRVKELAAGV